MANLASYVGIEPRTVIATSVAIVRGVRLTLDSSGTVSAAAIGVKGEFASLEAIAASSTGAAVSMNGGGKIPALASEAVAVGDAAYSAAAGKFSKTSTSAVAVGVWSMAASGDGVLGEVELS